MLIASSAVHVQKSQGYATLLRHSITLPGIVSGDTARLEQEPLMTDVAMAGLFRSCTICFTMGAHLPFATSPVRFGIILRNVGCAGS
jgi:hypothetical protein